LFSSAFISKRKEKELYESRSGFTEIIFKNLPQAFWWRSDAVKKSLNEFS